MADSSIAFTSFEAFYHSVYHRPLLLWLAALAFFLLRWPKRRFLYAYLWIFAVETVLDPLLTGPFIEWFWLQDTEIEQAIRVGFLLLGPFRVFLLYEQMATGKATRGGSFRALGWTLVVPGLIGTAQQFGFLHESRAMFFIYELAFVLLNVAYAQWVLSPRAKKANAWLLRVSRYVSVYYALWALADLVILAAPSHVADWGYALRIIPNLLHYSLYLPFIVYAFTLHAQSQQQTPNIDLQSPEPQKAKPTIAKGHATKTQAGPLHLN